MEPIDDEVGFGQVLFDGAREAFIHIDTDALNRGLQSVRDGALGVHQFRGARTDVGEASAQSAMTLLASYLDEMDVDRRLLDVAALTPANQLFPLSIEDAGLLNVDNTRPPVGVWTLEADDDGRLYASVTQEQAGRAGGSVTLVLTRRGASLLGVVRIDRPDGAFDNRDADQAFANAPCPTLRRGESVTGREYPIQCANAWRRVSRSAFAITFAITPAVAAMMAEAPELRVDSNFPMVFYSLGSDVVLSTKGLKRSIAALRR